MGNRQGVMALLLSYVPKEPVSKRLGFEEMGSLLWRRFYRLRPAGVEDKAPVIPHRPAESAVRFCIPHRHANPAAISPSPTRQICCSTQNARNKQAANPIQAIHLG